MVCVLVMGASDAALLQLGNTYFSGGFNGLFVDTPLRKLGFFAAGLAPDAALVLGIWAFLIPLVKRPPGSRLQHFAFTALATLAVPLLIDYVGYSLHYVLGNMVDPLLLWILSGHDSVEVASQMSAYVDPFVFVLLAASLATIAALSLVARVEPRIARSGAHFAPPRTALLWLAFPASLLIGTAVLVGTSKASPQINYGLTR